MREKYCTPSSGAFSDLQRVRNKQAGRDWLIWYDYLKCKWNAALDFFFVYFQAEDKKRSNNREGTRPLLYYLHFAEGEISKGTGRPVDPDADKRTVPRESFQFFGLMPQATSMRRQEENWSRSWCGFSSMPQWQNVAAARRVEHIMRYLNHCGLKREFTILELITISVLKSDQWKGWWWRTREAEDERE